jgi:hypothetical protein
VIDPRILSGIGPAAVAGAPQFLARLEGARIGLSVGSEPKDLRLGELVADGLFRLFPSVVPEGSGGARVVEAARAWVGRGWAGSPGPLDAAIVVGNAPTPDAAHHVFVGADGWRALLSAHRSVGLGATGLGYAAASFLAVLETFKIVFAGWIEGNVERFDDISWSLFDWSLSGSHPGPDLRSLDLGELVWVGGGAIAHGAFIVLPDLEGVHGRIHLIDPDQYGSGSALRYPGARLSWLDQVKVEKVREWLTSGTAIELVPHHSDMNTWFASERPDSLVPLLVSTPDSKEARRQAALKLPRTAINGWAERFAIGVETFPFRPGRCLGCAYPIDAEATSETAVYSQETGLKPWRVRELLDTATALSEADLATIAGHLGIDPAALRGKTLRSVREMLCASGRLAAPNGAPVDVPLGFVAGLAGVGVLAEVIRDRIGASTGKRWQWDARRLFGMDDWPMGPSQSCFVCGDDDFVTTYRAKYG